VNEQQLQRGGGNKTKARTTTQFTRDGQTILKIQIMYDKKVKNKNLNMFEKEWKKKRSCTYALSSTI
jgi:hypothetical protein